MHETNCRDLLYHCTCNAGIEFELLIMHFYKKAYAKGFSSEIWICTFMLVLPMEALLLEISSQQASTRMQWRRNMIEQYNTIHIIGTQI